MLKDMETLKGLMGVQDEGLIQKALTVANGFLGVNLESPAKLMLPFVSVMRNRVPVDRPKSGSSSATWRMQLGYGGFDFAGGQGTAFGGVGTDVAGNALTVDAPYKTQAIRGSVQYEAIPMSSGFDDPMSIETSRVLATLMRLEELILLGGNTAALSTITPTAGDSGVGGAAFGAGNWRVQVTALTLQGTVSNSSANSNVGETNVAAAVTRVVPVGGATYLTVAWAVVPGAVGYKVYCDDGIAGTIRLVEKSKLAYKDGTAITADGTTYVTVNSVRITAAPANTQPIAPAADATAQANVFEGLISWVMKSTVYGQALGTKTYQDMAGAKLTTAGSGVTEFDTILQNLWNAWQISPTVIVAGSKSVSHLTDQLVAANNAAMYRLEIAQERNSFVGGIFVGGYVNKYAASVLPGQAAVIPVIAHPYMVDGTYLFLTERIPYAYSREARGFALDLQTPYTWFELARTDRSFPFSLFFTEVLKCYHPLAQAYISGARVE